MMLRILCLLVVLVLSLPLTAQATITKVQSTTSATTSIALTGVTAGNTLVLMVGWYRDTGTDAVFPTPTDSNGTVAVATSPAPADDSLNAHDMGAAIFYVTNANAGTHTFTLNATSNHATLAEFTPMAAASFDVAANARTQGSSSATSQVTGTTGSTAQANELVVIAASLAVTSSGTSDVGWTDPVPGYTTLQKTSNVSTDLPVLHAWKEVTSTGTQAATFNWTTGNATGFMQAAIATFKSTSGGGGTSGTIYYVAPTGSDSNPGTSVSPFKNPQKCVNVMVPGDTCTVADGTYTEQGSDQIVACIAANSTCSESTAQHGTAGSPITLKSTNPLGAHITIPGGGANSNLGIYVGRNYWIIQDFDVSGGSATGATASHSAIEVISATGVTLRRNSLHHVARTLCYNAPYGNTGIYAAGTTNLTLDNNLIYSIGRLRDGESGCSTTIYQHDHGVYYNGGSGLVIKRNLFYDTNRGWPLHFYSAAASNLTVVNNTFADHCTASSCPSMGQILIGSAITTGIFKDNIFSSPTTAPFRMYVTAGHSGVAVAFNLSDVADADMLETTASGFTSSNNLVSTSPGFTNAATRNYTLAAGSAAIDSGTDVGIGGCNGVCDRGYAEFGTIVADTTPPTVPTGLTVTANLPNQLLIAWTASTDNISVVGYNVQACTPSVCTPAVTVASPTGTSYTYAGLPDATGYSVRVNAFDAAGNQGAFTSVVSTTTQTIASPTLSNANPSGAAVSDASPITINVTTSIPSVCKYNTRTEGTAAYAALLHAMTVSGLVASASVTPDQHGSNGGVNHFYIACDNAVNPGHASATLDMTFTMIAPVDTTAPSTISDFTLTPLDSVRLQATWTAATDAVGVTGYLLSGCAGDGCTSYNITLNSGPGTTSAVLALSTGTVYNFIIQAYDAAGNNAVASNVATTQTLTNVAPEDMANLSLAAILQQAVILQWSTPLLQASSALFEQCTPKTSSTTCSGTWSQVAVIPLGTLPLMTGLAANTSYCWRGKLGNDQQQVSTNYSNVTCTTTMSAGLTRPRGSALLPRATRTP